MNKKNNGAVFLILVFVGILFVIAAIALYFFPLQLPDWIAVGYHPQVSPTAIGGNFTPTPTLLTVTDTPRVTPTRERLNGKTYTIEPYTYTITIPYDWTLEFYNETNPITGEQCTTYRAQSLQSYAVLEIKQFCGEGSAGFDECKNTHVIGKLHHNEIVRYVSGDALRYFTYKGTEYGCVGWILGFGHPLIISAYYRGPDSEWPRYLDTIDRIVLSLDNAP